MKSTTVFGAMVLASAASCPTLMSQSRASLLETMANKVYVNLGLHQPGISAYDADFKQMYSVQGLENNVLLCTADNQACKTNEECCSKYCEARPAPGGMRYYCMARESREHTTQVDDPTPQCNSEGRCCKLNRECCSKNCTAIPGDSCWRCTAANSGPGEEFDSLPAADCKPWGAKCNSASDCCSKQCLKHSDGVYRCY